MNSRTIIPWAGWWWWWVDFMNTPSLGGGRGLHEHSFLGGWGGDFMNTPSLAGGGDFMNTPSLTGGGGTS